ncbi:tRNA-i(6)A37 methylthiotransferase [Bacteroidales bacterium]|nr:tRNA-i(6)A37 methylthiotransferase [Bacteroidales bacterium]
MPNFAFKNNKKQMIDSQVFENKKAAYYTLGCKLNYAETSTIGQQLASEGIHKVEAGEIADICIVNTCSVTDVADKKCRYLIRKIQKDHPKAFVVVTGCYAQLKPQEVASIEGVDLVLGTNQKIDILLHLRLSLSDKQGYKLAISPVKDICDFTHSCSQDYRTRSFLKVQDGCDYYCTYCTIPFARGRSRNGKIEDLVAKAVEVAASGVKEIVLTGVNIGDFGRSTDNKLIDLLIALDEVDGIERFRISSIEPNLLTDEILNFVAQSKRFAPHFHIPLQSGSDSVLTLMRRKYDTALFASKVYKIKELMPEAFIGVDVIVGVRGETEEYFEQTCSFIESLQISQLHVFTYSEREGTQALKIEHVVDVKSKQKRSKRLAILSEKKLLAFYNSQEGREKTILFEHSSDGELMFGFSDNYVKVYCPYDESFVNSLKRCVVGTYDSSVSAVSMILLPRKEEIEL